MKVTNKIDKLGRIVVPIKMRKALDVEQGMAFNVTLYEKTMILEVRSEESKIVGSIRKIDELAELYCLLSLEMLLVLRKTTEQK